MAFDFDGTEMEGLFQEEPDEIAELPERAGPMPRAFVPNPARFRQLKEAYRALRQAVLEASLDARIDWGMEEDLFSAYITVRAKFLQIDDVRAFLKGLAYADDIEIFAISDREVIIDITFYNVYIPIA